jgi:hypothetical protein
MQQEIKTALRATLNLFEGTQKTPVTSQEVTYNGRNGRFALPEVTINYGMGLPDINPSAEHHTFPQPTSLDLMATIDKALFRDLIDNPDPQQQ